MYHSVHYPCDVYSLGMLALQTLLANRHQRMGEVRKNLVESLESDIRRFRKEHRDASFDETVSFARGLISKSPVAGTHNVFHDADPNRANAIPKHLWQDLLLTAVRMVTHIPGFSYCGHRSDYPEDLSSPLGPIVKDLAALTAQVHTVLFGQQGIHEEIRDALNLIREGGH